MNKKGFTLVELLAVLVILAVILVIAIPSVTSIISNSKLNSFYASSDMLERVARTYLSANNITVASGTTSYILYSDMKNAGYIGKVSDPTSNNECTHSGVYVTNTSGIYAYKGALVCDNYMDIDSYNLVNNGNFSNGTTGWTSYDATLSLSSNILTITNNGTATSGHVYEYTGTPVVAGHKYYLYLKLRITNSQCNLLYMSAGNDIAWPAAKSISSPIQNQWYIMSGIVTFAAGSSNLSIYAGIHNYADISTANGKVMQVDGNVGIYAFDLTSIYGSSNEPTAAQMDNIMKNIGK